MGEGGQGPYPARVARDQEFLLCSALLFLSSRARLPSSKVTQSKIRDIRQDRRRLRGAATAFHAAE